jgi:hypothetical protein
LFVCFIVFFFTVDNKNGEIGTSAFELFFPTTFFFFYGMYLIALMQMKVLLLVVVVAVVIETTSACDCNYHSGGCAMVRPASRGMACKCVLRLVLGFICHGRQVGCRDQNHHLCQNPNTSKDACIFANGECGGY